MTGTAGSRHVAVLQAPVAAQTVGRLLAERRRRPAGAAREAAPEILCPVADHAPAAPPPRAGHSRPPVPGEAVLCLGDI